MFKLGRIENYTGEYKESVICIDKQSIRDGLIKEIGTKEFVVLTVILSFVDSKGYSRISQREVAKYTGLSLPTVNKVINSLLNVKINDKSIIERKLINGGERKTYSLYRLVE